MKNKKVGIIGVGNVGSTIANNLATKAMCSEIVLRDIRQNYTQAMALDISQASNAAKSHTKVVMSKDASDLQGCDIVVITAGIARKPGMSRNDLLLTNNKIMSSIITDIKDNCPDAILIIVSNPLDAMVYAALKSSGFNRTKVIGMAGILDSARMSHYVQEELGYGAGQIESSVMGGHGDDMVPLTNYSTVNGICIEKLLSDKQINSIVEKTKTGGLEIVKLLETGSAYYAPALGATLMVDAILNNTKKIYPCAVMLEGEYSYKNVVAGVPVMLGCNGVEKIIELDLNETQKKNFSNSVASVRELIDIIDA